MIDANTLEAYELASRDKAERQRQKDRRHRQVKKELRKDPHRGCLIGNTMSPGTPIDAFLLQLQRLA